LSLNDDEFIRETFKDFKIGTIDTRYTFGREAGRRVRELIIKNF